MNPGKIIFINGVSSSGKSALAKELQRTLEEPFLHLHLDAFIEMLPRTDDIPMFLKMTNGMHRSIAAMSDAGNNLIVDHVVIEKIWLDECLNFLADRYVLFVGLHCSLEELERRERKRDARRQGFAKEQLPKIHQDKVYDLELDTEALSAKECAQQVIEFYNGKQPSAFDQMGIAID